MDVTIRDERREYRRLRDAYQRAWNNFRTAMNARESCLLDGRPDADQASERVVAAELAYSEHRNRLADYLLSRAANESPSGTLHPDNLRHDSEQLDLRVNLMAYQLWEQRGRRHGEAQADWYRAEALLRSHNRGAMNGTSWLIATKTSSCAAL